MSHLILPGLIDKHLKGRWRGEVLDLSRSGRGKVVAIVYGKTLREMRGMKQLVYQTFRAWMPPGKPAPAEREEMP